MPTAYLVTGEEDTTAHPIVGETLIGRDPACDLVLSDITVSRRHAAVRQDGNTVVVSDLGSSNGTFVNGEPVGGRRRLRDGDALRIGTTVLVFRNPKDQEKEALKGEVSRFEDAFKEVSIENTLLRKKSGWA